MNKKELISNTRIAFFAQGASMLLSMLQSLLIPKMLGVTEFGYWQLFIFYIGYVGFFHLGLNDGVYLIKGGQSRDVIDKKSLNSQFVIGLLFQTVIACLIVFFSLITLRNGQRLFVIVSASVYLVIQNSATYFMFVLQAMNETKRSSYSTMLNRLSYLLPLVALLVFRCTSFKPFIVFYIFSAALQLAFCGWFCRDILSSGLNSWSCTISDASESIRAGSKLMLANIASSFIVGVLRLSIDAKWGIQAFGKLSLSLSLCNFFLAFVSQAAMVLFPALRQSGKNEIRSFFISAKTALGLFFPVVYLLYYPMVFVLSAWLPEYTESLRYLIWLIPICVFDSKMNITCTTMFKVRREESTLLMINVVSTLISSLLVAFATLFLESLQVATIFAMSAIVLRSIVSERIMCFRLDVPMGTISAWEIVLTILFLITANMFKASIAAALYLVVYVGFIFAHRAELNKVLKAIRA